MITSEKALIRTPIQRRRTRTRLDRTLPSPMSRPAQITKAPIASQNRPPQSSQLWITLPCLPFAEGPVEGQAVKPVVSISDGRARA